VPHNDNAIERDLPNGLSKPATRALSGTGYLRHEQFAKPQGSYLHGTGPKAMDLISDTLATKGLSFAKGS